ncbi:MAG: hypothetical protein J6P07_03290, partial [Spirochaetaceae bacterium]|nr:hypothetical protein [Spirochaetaceae bacterium]
DRPILNYVSKNELASARKPVSMEFAHCKFDDCFKALELIDTCKTSSFVHIGLGKRHKPAPLASCVKFFKKIMKTLCILTGTVVNINVNYNFDYFYASLLPVLLKKGLTDYYITENLEDVYLLWE